MFDRTKTDLILADGNPQGIVQINTDTFNWFLYLS
jgi:hypothetical protein